MVRRAASEKLKLLDEYIHALLRRFHLHSSQDGAAAELSGSEILALNLLGRRGRCTMSELATECGMVLSSMTAVVDRLVAKGCVKRFRDDKEDRRKVYAELDRKGEKIYQNLLEAEMEMIITMMDALKPEEQDAVLEALGKAVGSVAK